MKAIAIFDDGSITGTVIFSQQTPNNPLKIVFDLCGFIPNSIHAIHIHEFGDLREGCKSLGPHFNPTGKQHSSDEKGHCGDLFNNLQTDDKGNFNGTYYSKVLSIFPNKFSIVGRSVVIHQFPDDCGTEGIFISKRTFVKYRDMTTEQLRSISSTLGYPYYLDRSSLIKKLETESKTTGNASTRIACSIIAFCKD